MPKQIGMSLSLIAIAVALAALGLSNTYAEQRKQIQSAPNSATAPAQPPAAGTEPNTPSLNAGEGKPPAGMDWAAKIEKLEKQVTDLETQLSKLTSDFRAHRHEYNESIYRTATLYDIPCVGPIGAGHGQPGQNNPVEVDEIYFVPCADRQGDHTILLVTTTDGVHPNTSVQKTSVPAK